MDFDDLLALSGRWSGSAAKAPEHGEPIRCVLFPNPLLIQGMGSFALVKKQRLMRSLWEPQLYVDVDDDGVKVIDPNTNALKGSAARSQATATPAMYQLEGGHAFPSAENIASDAAGEYFSTMPAVTLTIGGVEPLTIGCRDFQGLQRRFSWSGNVRITNDPPAYTVSAADWLALVEKFGLARNLEDTGN
ncbi:MAG TPA: hypothetical protein VFB19_08780 [Mycobacterium sp.]|nr:hypothetical protein [Mycobacterium sp.]